MEKVENAVYQHFLVFPLFLIVPPTHTPFCRKDAHLFAREKQVCENLHRTFQRKAAAAVIATQTPEEVQETLSKWRPPDWLTDVIPRKQPYFPQMGDELMYFRQGHELYVKAVERRQAYPIDISKKQPWHKNPSLRVS